MVVCRVVGKFGQERLSSLRDAWKKEYAYQRVSCPWFRPIALAILALLAMGFSGKVTSQIVTVTVTGTVEHGWDQTGLFGVAGNFDGNMDGLPFTAVYTFDSSKGVESVSINSSTGLPYWSKISQSGTNSPDLSPGTATLTINGRTVSIGTSPVFDPAFYYVSSYSIRNTGTGISGANFDVLESNGKAISDKVTANLQIAIRNGSGTPVFDIGHYWYDPFSHTLVASDWYDGSFGYTRYYSAPSVPFDSASGSLIPVTVTVSGANSPSSPSQTDTNNLGDCRCTGEGNPINSATGNKFQVETDFVGAAHTGLELRRYYNSQDTTSTPFGANWHSTWYRAIASPDSNTAKVTREDGRSDTFTKNASGVWTPQPNVTSKLSAVMNGSTPIGWKLVTTEDDTELYNLDGQLLSVTNRAGRITTLAYDDLHRLSTVTGPFGHQLIFGYDPSNRVATVTLPDQGVLAYAYDANNNPVSVTYPDHSVRQYVYNEQSNTSNTNLPHALTGIIDENNKRFATYTYNTDGKALSSEHAGGAEKVTLTYNPDGSAEVTDALGHMHGYTFTTLFGRIEPATLTGAPVPTAGGKAITYDVNGFVASRTDFNDHLTSYVHNARGLEVARTEAKGTPEERTITTEWHPTFHLPAQIIEPSGVPGLNRVTTFTYNKVKGTLLKKMITAGKLSRTWKYAYNAAGLLKTATDPNGHVTKFAYDAQGGLAQITNAKKHVTTLVNNADGRPVTITDPNGLVTQLVWTPRGWLQTKTVGQEVTDYDYDAAGNLTRITRPDNSFLVYTYNDAHQLTRIDDALGNHIDYTRNLTGNVTAENVYDTTNTLKRTVSYEYDEVNRLSQSIGALNQITDYERDDNGNIVAVNDPNHHHTVYRYDALNRLAERIDPNIKSTQIDHNPDDSIATVTDPRHVATHYSYDGLGNQIAIQSPDSGLTVRTFDKVGNIKTSIDARGKKTTFVYDPLDRLVKKTFADRSKIVYTYDQGINGKGRLTAMTDPSGKTTWIYDQHGHVLQKVQTIGQVTLTTTNTYDPVTGQLTQTILPSGQVLQYQYDANGQTAAISNGATPLISGITYEPFGPPSAWDQGNATIHHVRNFDQDGHLVTIAFGNNAAPGNTQTITLTRDPAGLITQIADNTADTKSFGYDALDELTDYTASGLTEAFTYDENGNRTQFSTNAPHTTNYTIDAGSNRLVSQTLDNTATIPYTLDAVGNLISDGSRTFTFNARGTLTSVVASGLTTSYLTNGLGERARKSSPLQTTLFTQDAAGNITGEYDGTGAAIQETVYLENLPVAVLKSGVGYFINPDHLGTPRIIMDSTGTPVWSWDREPFGNSQPSGTLIYNPRFPGQYYDAETGLHHNGFRDYDPATGRYIESDPIGLDGGINPYIYAFQSPTIVSDRNGLKVNVYSFSIGWQYGWLMDSTRSGGRGASIGIGISRDANGNITDFGLVDTTSKTTAYHGIGFGATLGLTSNIFSDQLTDFETNPCEKPSQTIDIDFGQFSGVIGGIHYSDDGSFTTDMGFGGRSIFGGGLSESKTKVYSIRRFLSKVL
jgi:RHS repeat-associated protein